MSPSISTTKSTHLFELKMSNISCKEDDLEFLEANSDTSSTISHITNDNNEESNIISLNQSSNNIYDDPYKGNPVYFDPEKSSGNDIAAMARLSYLLPEDAIKSDSIMNRNLFVFVACYIMDSIANKQDESKCIDLWTSATVQWKLAIELLPKESYHRDEIFTWILGTDNTWPNSFYNYVDEIRNKEIPLKFKKRVDKKDSPTAEALRNLYFGYTLKNTYDDAKQVIKSHLVSHWVPQNKLKSGHTMMCQLYGLREYCWLRKKALTENKTLARKSQRENKKVGPTGNNIHIFI
jgi:hypothetical protein